MRRIFPLLLCLSFWLLGAISSAEEETSLAAEDREAIQEVIRQTEKGEAHIRYLEDLARKVESPNK